MKVRALITFNDYHNNITASASEEFEIADKGVRLDLEKLGFIVPIGTQTHTEH